MSSHRKDGNRIVALLEAVESLQRGEQTTLGELVARVFGWPDERAFLAIDNARARGLIDADANTKGGA